MMSDGGEKESESIVKKYLVNSWEGESWHVPLTTLGRGLKKTKSLVWKATCW